MCQMQSIRLASICIPLESSSDTCQSIKFPMPYSCHANTHEFLFWLGLIEHHAPNTLIIPQAHVIIIVAGYPPQLVALVDISKSLIDNFVNEIISISKAFWLHFLHYNQRNMDDVRKGELYTMVDCAWELRFQSQSFKCELYTCYVYRSRRQV